MRRSLIILSIVVLISAFSFSAYGQAPDAGRDTISVTGTIQHFSYEGGFYGIAGDDGNTYRPSDLSSGFQVEGLRVKATLRPAQKKLLFGPWVIPVEIISIQKER